MKHAAGATAQAYPGAAGLLGRLRLRERTGAAARGTLESTGLAPLLAGLGKLGQEIAYEGERILSSSMLVARQSKLQNDSFSIHARRSTTCTILPGPAAATVNRPARRSPRRANCWNPA